MLALNGYVMPRNVLTLILIMIMFKNERLGSLGLRKKFVLQPDSEFVGITIKPI